MNMPMRALGGTELRVSALGLGCGGIGREDVSDARAEEVLETALGLGINVFDAARSYDRAEHRLGRFMSRHRDRIVVSTKVGYGIEGHDDWTAPCIAAGVEEARALLDTDVIDIVHLHSCPREVLQRGEVTDALAEAVAAGTIRCAAYSGENEALAFALTDDRFAVVQTSVNVCDQHSIRNLLPAADRAVGVIGKRSVANAFWRFSERPVGNYAELYWQRWRDMGLGDIDPAEVALRFSAFAPGVNTALLGTTSVDNLMAGAQQVARGPLPAEIETRLRDSFAGRDWPGDI